MGEQQAHYSFLWSFTVDFSLSLNSFFSWNEVGSVLGKKIPIISERIRYSLATQLCSLRWLVKHYSFWKQLDQTREVVPYIVSHWE